MFGIDQSARSHGGLFSFFLHLCGPLLLEESLQADALGLVYPGNPLLYRGGSTGIYGFSSDGQKSQDTKESMELPGACHICTYNGHTAVLGDTIYLLETLDS
jgi:hypothetical protein